MTSSSTVKRESRKSQATKPSHMEMRGAVLGGTHSEAHTDWAPKTSQLPSHSPFCRHPPRDNFLRPFPFPHNLVSWETSLLLAFIPGSEVEPAVSPGCEQRGACLPQRGP